MAPKNYFETLEISPGADENQIKKAYRTLAKKWHPDKNSNPGAKEKFQEIAAAYEYLSSKDRREILERDLHRQTTQPPQKASQPNKPASPHSSENTQKKESKKPNAASWSETFTKNYRSQQAKANAEQNKSFSYTPENKNHNFKFTDFKTDKPPSPDSDTEDLYDELFGDVFSSMKFKAPGGISEGFMGTSYLGGSRKFAKKKKKPRPRDVAPERGSPAGLDEEYLFTPRHKSQNEFEEKLSCPWCNQEFTRGKLSQHEEKCGKFGLSADEESENEVEDDFCDMDYITTVSKPMYSWKPIWQQRQDELRDKIRRDKSLYKEHLANHDNKNNDLIKCPYCECEFNYTTAGKHIPWCKEFIQKYGKPMNRRGSTERESHTKEKAESDLLYEAFKKKKDKDTGILRERMKEYADKNHLSGQRRESWQEEMFLSGNSMPFKRNSTQGAERKQYQDEDELTPRTSHAPKNRTFHPQDKFSSHAANSGNFGARSQPHSFNGRK